MRYLDDNKLNTVLENYFIENDIKELIEDCINDPIDENVEILTEATKFPLKISFKTNKLTKKLWNSCKEAEDVLNILNKDGIKNKHTAIKALNIVLKVLRNCSEIATIFIRYAGVIGLGSAMSDEDFKSGDSGFGEFAFGSRRVGTIMAIMAQIILSPILFVYSLIPKSISYCFRCGEDAVAKKYSQQIIKELEGLKKSKALNKSQKDQIDKKIKAIEDNYKSLKQQKVFGKSIPEKINDNKNKIKDKKEEIKSLEFKRNNSDNKKKYQDRIDKLKKEIKELEDKNKEYEEKLK